MSIDTYPITVVILAKNEAHNIRRCLESLDWAQERVLVDDGSTDTTVSIAIECGARVVKNAFKSFAQQRNWALQHAELECEWVLMLDADEVATPEFAKCLQNIIQDAPEDVVALKTCRKTMLDDVWLRYSDGFPVWIMRVVKRGKALFADSGHGEVPVPEVDGRMGTVMEPFVHYPFSRGMDDWWERHTRYAKHEAVRECLEARGGGLLGLVSLDVSRRRRSLRGLTRNLPLRGYLRFFYQYVLRGGFRDGKQGYRFCRMMGVYESMIATRKLELSTVRGDNAGASTFPIRDST